MRAHFADTLSTEIQIFEQISFLYNPIATYDILRIFACATTAYEMENHE